MRLAVDDALLHQRIDGRDNTERTVGYRLPADYDIQSALKFIRGRTREKPMIALVLGSGLADFGSNVKAQATFLASEIPGYPKSSVQGHPGRLIFGSFQTQSQKSLPLLIFQGRVHYYEAGSIERVTFPIFLAHRLGIRTLILTNAAGGINSSFSIGDLMFIDDAFGLTFLPVSIHREHSSFPVKRHLSLIDPGLQQIAAESAVDVGLSIRHGTYCWLKGPSYETAAEIQMLRYVGADAVGMSTVPELFVARQLGLRTIGISLISNMAAGISATKLSHTEVTAAASRVENKFNAFIGQFIASIQRKRNSMRIYERPL